MSIVDVWVSPTKAMVIVDTAGKRIDGGEGNFEISKMLYLPHANAVVAARGTNLFLNCLFSLLHLSIAQSCDDCDRLMFDLLKGAKASVQAMVEHGAAPAPASSIKNEVALVGYSDYYHAMHCVGYEEDGEGGFEAQEISEAYFLPWHESWGPAPRGFPSRGMASAIAQHQVVDLLQMHPDQPFGGRLLIAEMTREATSISQLWRF